METISNRNFSALLQISVLGQYIFPLGNFIFPGILWGIKKNDSAFIDQNGKHCLNFQLSLLVYSLLLFIAAVSLILYAFFQNGETFYFNNYSGWHGFSESFTAKRFSTEIVIALVLLFLLAVLKITEFVIVLYASIKNINGEVYRFPLTIKFIK